MELVAPPLASAVAVSTWGAISSARPLPLEPSEYFCQISSKSINIISSYTVSKLGRFLRYSVVISIHCALLLFMSLTVALSLIYLLTHHNDDLIASCRFAPWMVLDYMLHVPIGE